MKKTRQRAGTKETKKRNSREIKEAAQQWASLEAVRRVRTLSLCVVVSDLFALAFVQSKRLPTLRKRVCKKW